jgi:isochorismate pyruvate lyase
MTDEVLFPDDCLTMADVRAGVDATDAALVGLLQRRFGYMRAAARIKPERGAVRDVVRKAQVIDNVRALGEAAGLPPERLAAVWEVLVEQSIAYEFDIWDRTRG